MKGESESSSKFQFHICKVNRISNYTVIFDSTELLI